MAREPDADSRPISVAELMARARELDDASTGGGASDGAGRRRRGGAGSVSFAELTGELPRVSDAPSADPGSRFVPDEPTARAEPSRAPFPRSEPPRPTREPEVFPLSEAPVGRPFEAPARPAAWAAPEHGDRPVHPPTRDISSGAIQDRFRDQRRAVSDDAVETGIIPRVEPGPESDVSTPPTGSLDLADLDDLSPQEREREFERYRNFEDIDGFTEPEPEPKKKRGRLGGLLRGRSETADEGSRDHLRDSGDLDFADDRVAERRTDFGPQIETFPHDEAAPRSTPVPDGRRRRDVDAETQVVDLDRAQLDSDPEFAAEPDARPWRSERDRRDHADVTPTDVTPADDTATDDQGGASPARQWAMLGIQVVVGLVVGVGLFLGFHELWKWNVYFALVLAVVVMFGMVTTVHVARRSQDLASTLLALGVGLIVTIGPLVLLASGS